MIKSEEMMPPTVLYQDLDRAMWITKHCRYIASDRLRKKHILSIYTISILSIYVVVISLLDRYGLIIEYDDIYELLSVASAIFILVLSLTEASKNYSVASGRLFVSGNEIRELLDELKKYCGKTECDIAGIQDISKKYSQVLKGCRENHETIDYDLFRAQRPTEFDGMNWFFGIWRFFLRAKYLLNIYWFYFVLIFSPPIVFFKFA